MTLPKSATLVGLLLAIAAVIVDPAATPWLAALLGEQAATKLAAVGALIAAFGKALTFPKPLPAPPAE